MEKDSLTSLEDAILALKTREEVTRFFQDLCTPKEWQALQERWRVCQLLSQGTLSYRNIHDQTGVSLTTIARVARFLNQEKAQGYKLVLSRLLTKG